MTGRATDSLLLRLRLKAVVLTKESDLGKGRSLTGHHVEEFAENGEPTRENVWVVCTGCHAMIHWLRTYRKLTEAATCQ